MVTAVSGFIEQVGSMIKGIPKHNDHQSTPSSFKELAQTLTIASQPISVHRQLSNSEPDNSHQMMHI